MTRDPQAVVPQVADGYGLPRLIHGAECCGVISCTPATVFGLDFAAVNAPDTDLTQIDRLVAPLRTRMNVLFGCFEQFDLIPQETLILRESLVVAGQEERFASTRFAIV